MYLYVLVYLHMYPPILPTPSPVHTVLGTTGGTEFCQTEKEDFMKHLLYFHPSFFTVVTHSLYATFPGLNSKALLLNETVSTVESVTSVFCKFHTVGK